MTEKRKAADHNFTELIFAIAFHDKSVETYEQIIDHPFSHQYPKYLADLKLRSKIVVEKYLTSTREMISEQDFPPVSRVEITGKNPDQCDNTEVIELNKGLSHKEKKSDVMVKFENGEWKGFSIKASSDASLSGYSVEKIFFDKRKELKAARHQIVKDAGLPHLYRDYRQAYVAAGKTKEFTDMYNSLFYSENPYWVMLGSEIEDNKSTIIREWSKGMFPQTPYRLFQFDGEKLFRMDGGRDLSTFDLIRTEDPRRDPKGSAKIFYSVRINGLEEWRWEIRFKNGAGIYSAQIETFHPLVYKS